MILRNTKKLSITILTLFIGLNDVSAQANDEKMALSPKQKGIVGISALSARGNLERLSLEMVKGLDAGLTINEIKEVLVQLAAYTGFPRSLNAINTLKKVADERKDKGIVDPIGDEPLKLDSSLTRYALGKQNLGKLSGRAETGKAGYALYVPVIEVFLKEHLFADIFSRGVLSYQDRELVTVSALTALGGVEGQLQSHLGLSIYNGFQPTQLSEMFTIIRKLIGKAEAKAGEAVLKKVVAGGRK